LTKLCAYIVLPKHITSLLKNIILSLADRQRLDQTINTINAYIEYKIHQNNKYDDIIILNIKKKFNNF